MLRKYAKFLLLAVLFMLFSSCAAGTGEADKKYEINDPERGLSVYEFETVFLLCKDFLNNYYSAVTNESEMHAEKYISNDNLMTYVNKLLENGTYPASSSSKIEKIQYGLVNIEWHNDRQYVYLYLAVDVSMNYGGGFGEGHEFLVQNQDNRLVIVDWYSPGIGGSALFSVHREQNGKINDPYIWDDEEWVNDYFRRTHILEES